MTTPTPTPATDTIARLRADHRARVARAALYTLQTAAGRHIRRATKVVFPDGFAALRSEVAS